MKKLKEECGVTVISLDNLGLLSAVHGRVRFILHYAPTGTTMDDRTMIVFEDGWKHLATGFASGYGGEGPHGLLTAIQTYLKRDDITIEHISSWRGKQYLILPGKGNGEDIYFLSSTHDPHVNGCEVW